MILIFQKQKLPCNFTKRWTNLHFLLDVHKLNVYCLNKTCLNLSVIIHNLCYLSGNLDLMVLILREKKSQIKTHFSITPPFKSLFHLTFEHTSLHAHFEGKQQVHFCKTMKILLLAKMNLPSVFYL